MTLLGLMAACGPAEVSSDIFDPAEAKNRDIHAFNKSLDKNVLRPVSQGYGQAVPRPIRKGISNFANNLDLPGMVVNDLLQLKLADAAANTGRFLLNTTVGIGGLLDPASEVQLYARETDFGETLHVWGVSEGGYVELPVLGPSTERDTVGKIVDVAANPLRMIVPRDVLIANTVAGVGDTVNTRYEFSGTVDGVLYESADSYAQARLLYLQNRRFKLSKDAAVTGEPEYDDLYDDLYEDPYGE